ncbi:hypothetical protein BHE74_00036928 [Ensete ventricosum]|nr:hypothetical protein BHE74_00036928 [Ensete ventricosum]
MRWMGIDQMNGSFLSSSDPGGQTQVADEIQPDTDRIMSNSGSVLRGFGIDNKYSISSGSTEDENPSCNEALEEYLVYRIKNLDNRLITLPKVGSNQIVAFDEFKGSSGPSSLNQQLMLREDKASSKSDSSMRRKRTGWLRKLGAVACIVDRQGEESNSTFHESGIAGSGRVKVKPCGKRSKEFSAVYKVQDIKAHDGAILTMKSSPNDQCLASGGAEGIVLVWHVMVCERTNEISIPDNDPSCIYFTVNHSAELTPVHDDKKNTFKSRDMRRSADSACVFRLSEKLLHAFHRHDADVLDLSWSSDKIVAYNHLQTEAQIFLQGNNKSLNKQITGFRVASMEHQFFMIGISFYTRSQISASFTADGQRIISASEDCNVCFWSHVSHDIHTSNHVKSIWSCECFFSTNASIAIPWHGLESSYQISMTSDLFPLSTNEW